ncbi:eukaryotic translation initiation factor 4E isoform X3 [Mustela lutreola]|uniref:eukaryotic translation initiation factor 4E isoform X3 n=1 Tax=Mustela lutreola TaxID=9666 RepID=UPI0027978798|nr:eukaryotic translation initiation factor 4E isoform X3 [Mustela lutreola]
MLLQRARELPGLAAGEARKETTPTPNPPPTEEEKTESNQEVANPEHYIKHPLQNRWALWFFKNDKSKTWQANLRLISKFDTVEDFWALYNHIQLSSNLMPGCDYSLFKDGIEPMWEDEKNKRGGRWLITLNKQQRRSDLDRFWLETVSCCALLENLLMTTVMMYVELLLMLELKVIR